MGPWNDFEVVDGSQPGQKVGVRRKADGPNARIFTPQDFEKLNNYLIPYTPPEVTFPRYEEKPSHNIANKSEGFKTSDRGSNSDMDY